MNLGHRQSMEDTRTRMERVFYLDFLTTTIVRILEIQEINKNNNNTKEWISTNWNVQHNMKYDNE